MTMFDNEIQFKNYIKYYLSAHKLGYIDNY